MRVEPDSGVQVRGDGDLVIYSEEELNYILGDAFVDMREVVGDRDACECLDIIHQRLTDDFYHKGDE